MKETIWRSLVASLQAGQCVLVLGPDLPAVVAEGARQVPSKATRDLLRDYLANELAQEQQLVTETSPFAVAQQYDDSPAFSTTSLRNVAAWFYHELRCQPGPLHRALARLPFGLVLTTSHDNLMEQAYRERQVAATRYWYNFRGEPRDNKELASSPVPDAPAIYHLFGAYEQPNSMVLTENDLLDFLIRVISSRPKLPDSLRLALRDKTFLFFGFGIRYWNVRVLLKLMVRVLEVAAGSVVLESLGAAVDDREREHTALFYKRGSRIEVADMEALSFIEQLAERLGAAGGYAGPGNAEGRRPSVFISYERHDEDLARKLLEALPADKLEAWLDVRYLEPGQEWNEELERRLGEADYALVLNSASLAEKRVGYVNKEIQTLLDRQKYRQAGVKFIVPLLLEGTTVEQGLPALREFQQLPLGAGSMSADAQAVARVLLRDYQLRGRDQ